MASQDPSSLAEESSLHIIAAVDFGTSNSAVGFEFIEKDNLPTAKNVAPKVIEQYPKPNGSLSGKTIQKVPTEVSYEDEKTKCALEIRPNQDRLRWFKMALDPKAIKDSELGNKYPEHAAARNISRIAARQATIDYLAWLRNHFDRIIALHYGETVATTTSKSFIITVPAIWSHAAQELTKECAKTAGYGKDVITVSEPEAAVIHSLSVILPQKLAVGDKFIVIDAGGGTIDLISYAVEALGTNTKVKEIVSGSGKLAGGTFVDKEFAAFMNKRFSMLDKWSPAKVIAARNHFEERTKVDFDGDDEDGVLIPLPGLDDCPQLDLYNGYACLSLNEVKEIFEPVIKEVLDVVDEQRKKMQGKPRAILMVGGFGQSPYLVKRVQEHVGTNIEVLQPVHAQTAVVRGAVIKGIADFDPSLSRVKVESRVARKSYGLYIGTIFEIDKHDQSKQFWDPFHGEYRIKIVKPVVVKVGSDHLTQLKVITFDHMQGKDITEEDSVTFDLHSRQPVTSGPFGIDTITIWAHDDSIIVSVPSYKHQGWKPLAKMKVDLTSISASEYSVKTGHDGVKYFVIYYAIQAQYFSAHTEYRMFFNGKCYGSLAAEYV